MNFVDPSVVVKVCVKGNGTIYTTCKDAEGDQDDGNLCWQQNHDSSYILEGSLHQRPLAALVWAPVCLLPAADAAVALVASVLNSPLVIREQGEEKCDGIEVNEEDVDWATENWTYENGTIDEGITFSELCIDNYTYVPDDKFEQILLDLGYDDILDDFRHFLEILEFDLWHFCKMSKFIA